MRLARRRARRRFPVVVATSLPHSSPLPHPSSPSPRGDGAAVRPAPAWQAPGRAHCLSSRRQDRLLSRASSTRRVRTMSGSSANNTRTGSTLPLARRSHGAEVSSAISSASELPHACVALPHGPSSKSPSGLVTAVAGTLFVASQRPPPICANGLAARLVTTRANGSSLSSAELSTSSGGACRNAGRQTGCLSTFHQPGTLVGHDMVASTRSGYASRGTRAVAGGRNLPVPYARWYSGPSEDACNIRSQCSIAMLMGRCRQAYRCEHAGRPRPRGMCGESAHSWR